MTGQASKRTIYLGQFEHDTANTIAGELEEAGIAWTYKQSGKLASFLFAGEWGVRLFVDQDRIDEARTIVERVTTDADE